jgi:hypothetical protein
MAIKKQPVLTKEDFEAALVTLRLSVSEVSRESGLPRRIISHFRNYGDGLKPEQAAKLRDYFEAKGVEFTEDNETTPERAANTQGEQSATITSPSPRLDAGLKVEYFFPISNAIPDDAIGNAMDIMEEADARLLVLLKTKIERESGIFSEGELTKETKANLQEVFALMAGNYLVFRMLRGWRAFNVKPTTEKPETVRDMIFDTLQTAPDRRRADRAGRHHQRRNGGCAGT